MKKTTLILGFTLIAIHSFCQSDIAGPLGHQRTNTRYVGWSPGLGSIAGSLDVKNNFPSQPINFFAGGSTVAFQRMTILGTNGFVGIGNFPFTPANRLHLFQPSGTFGLQITNNTTGNGATDGFSMNLLGTGEFQFTQNSDQNVAFIMSQTPNPLMELTWNIGPNNFGQVQMRPFSNPFVGGTPIYDAALLNIGGAIGFSPNVTNQITNTLLYHNTSIAGATNDPAEDGFRVQYAFMSEGNLNGDCLVFEKTDGQSAFPDGCIKFTNYGSDDVQKLSMTIEGDGHVGIGRPYMSTISPWRRLSVDDTLTQLRLTYLATTAVSTDIYTDFFTDATGNLLIDPRNAGDANAGVVRVNYGTSLTQPFPGLSLDVNGQANIRTVNADNTSSFVLVWDQVTGNVRYRDINTFPGGGGIVGGAHNGTSMSLLDPTRVALGQDLNEPLNPGELLNDREIPMNNNNIVFTDNNAVSGPENRIGIGTDNPLGRMHIKVNTSIVDVAPVGLVVTNDQINNSANRGTEVQVSGGAYNIGSIVNTTGGQNTQGLAVATSDGTNTNYAISAYSQSLMVSPAIQNFGVFSSARYGILNIGGFFESYSNNPLTNENYGVKAVVSGTSNFNYGIYGAADALPNNYAGYFDGRVHVQGSITASGTITPSDEQFKTDVNDLTDAMDKINALQPRTFYYDQTNYSDFNFESDQQMGLIAQQVEQVIPTLVTNQIRPAKYDSLGIEVTPALNYKGVEYEELITLLIAGMQEQDVTITTQGAMIDSMTTINYSVNNYNDSLEQVVTDLNARLTQLENCLSNILPALCNANQMAVQSTPEEVQDKLRNVINVNLSDRNTIVLNQNVPNPFAESTIITYSIPSTVQKAQIHFYDATGKLINSVDIVERGNGQLNVFANDLSTGVYTYSLVADGQIVSTKRMMKQ